MPYIYSQCLQENRKVNLVYQIIRLTEKWKTITVFIFDEDDFEISNICSAGSCLVKYEVRTNMHGIEVHSYVVSHE